MFSATNRVREELQAALGVGQRLPTEQGEPRALEGLRGHDEPRARVQPRHAALERRAQLRREAGGRAEDLGEIHRRYMGDIGEVWGDIGEI